MPDYMQEFDDDFEFKDLPNESTPLNAENMGKALKNTRLLKRCLTDFLKNMEFTYEFTIFQGEKDFVDIKNDTSITQCYAMKQSLLNKFPLKNGYKRTAVLCVEGADKQPTEIKKKLKLKVGSSEFEFSFSRINGNNTDAYFYKQDLPNVFDNIPNGHCGIYVMPDTGTWTIRRIYWLITDKLDI